jgi:hypothetical protein
MQLDKLQFPIAKRTPAQACDIGFVLGKLWFWRLLKAWLPIALPMFALGLALFSYYPWLSYLLLWWLKPVYERWPLYIISRDIFSEPIANTSDIKQAWKTGFGQWLPNLTIRRLSFNRSFNAPVSLLEGLTGKIRTQRLNVLNRGQSYATWLSFACLCMEYVIFASLTSIAFMFIPEEFQGEFETLFIEGSNYAAWACYALYFCALALVSPFYVAAGFSLYLNRRVHLEGWDIELVFRQLAERARHWLQGSALVLCLGLSLWSSPNTAIAETASAQRSKEIIEEIMASDDFGEKVERSRWEKIEKTEPKEEDGEEADPGKFIKTLLNLIEWFSDLWSFMGDLALVTKIVLIAAVAAALGWILYRMRAWQALIDQFSKRAPRQEAPPTTLFGMDVTRESLPDDITAQVNSWLEQGHYRQALSLLYRATIAHLLETGKLKVLLSSTEGECLAAVRQNFPPSMSQYFGELTDAWIALAYAHKPPSLDTLSALNQQWGGLFHVEQP